MKDPLEKLWSDALPVIGTNGVISGKRDKLFNLYVRI